MGNTIKQTNPNKAGSPSDVEAKFIRYASIIISEHLSKIFDICLLKGVYSDDIKIVPIHKKGNR